MMDVQDKMAYQRYGKSFADVEATDREAIERALAQPIKSADRQVLSQGVRVFTNNLDRGTVDLSDLDYEWHAGEKRWVPWFDVLVDIDYKGNLSADKVLQSDDRVATRYNGRDA
jgi:hypothetical protein